MSHRHEVAVLPLVALGMMGCSLLFEPTTTNDDDASPAADAGQVVDGAASDDANNESGSDFEEGFNPWYVESVNGGCSLMPDPEDSSNQVVCCTSAPDTTNYGVITLAIPATRYLEVSFLLRPTSAPEAAWSALVAMDDDGDLSNVVQSNMNIHRDGTYAVVSVVGDGPLGSEPTIDFPINTWQEVTFTSSSLEGCPLVKATISRPEASGTAYIDITPEALTPFEFVHLGVLRQHSTSGTNGRCFDDVVVRTRTSCP